LPYTDLVPIKTERGTWADNLHQPTFGHGGNARFDEEVITMVSKAVAGVDGWLGQAEQILREQNERSLSPSSEPVWGNDSLESAISLAEFGESLESLLGTLCQRPGRWILIVEDVAHPHHFWQALAYEDGSLVTEVVSNFYLDGEDVLDPGQEDELVFMGWERPEPPRRPNWIHVEDTTSPAVAQVARQAIETLRGVFGLDDEDRVIVRLFSSPNRGDTPASPEYLIADQHHQANT
jgi:hypothetical protein